MSSPSKISSNWTAEEYAKGFCLIRYGKKMIPEKTEGRLDEPPGQHRVKIERLGAYIHVHVIFLRRHLRLPLTLKRSCCLSETLRLYL